jgi:hypothetical protein
MALLILVPFGVVEAVTHRAVMLELIPQSVRIITNEPRWGLRRAQTVFGHPILFGVFCSTGFGLFWYVMRSKLTRVGGTALAFVGTFVSLSSGALLSVVFQTIFMGWEMMTKSIPRRWTIFSILFLLLNITIDLLSNRTPFHVLVSYATFNSGTAYYRILIWEYGIENVWTNPMFGLGANIEQWVRASWMHSSADNYWLLLAMQFGIPCFLFLASALFFILRGVSLAPLKDPLGMACRAGYLTAIGGLIIAGGTVHYWHGVMAFVMFFFGAGVWVIDAAENEQKIPNLENADEKLEGEDTDQGLIYTRQVARHRRAGAPQKAQRRQAGLRGYAGRARAIAKHDRSG